MADHNWVFNLFDPDQGVLREFDDGVRSRIFSGENLMLSVITLPPHSEGELHHHPEEQWGVLIEGECVRLQDGEAVAMGRGDFWHTPGGTVHTIRTGAVGATILDVFSPPREAYLRPGRGVAGS